MIQIYKSTRLQLLNLKRPMYVLVLCCSLYMHMHMAVESECSNAVLEEHEYSATETVQCKCQLIQYVP